MWFLKNACHFLSRFCFFAFFVVICELTVFCAVSAIFNIESLLETNAKYHSIGDLAFRISLVSGCVAAFLYVAHLYLDNLVVRIANKIVTNGIKNAAEEQSC